jgi:hypothetical protein
MRPPRLTRSHCSNFLTDGPESFRGHTSPLRRARLYVMFKIPPMISFRALPTASGNISIPITSYSNWFVGLQKRTKYPGWQMAQACTLCVQELAIIRNLRSHDKSSKTLFKNALIAELPGDEWPNNLPFLFALERIVPFRQERADRRSGVIFVAHDCQLIKFREGHDVRK